ncbi:MAG: D-alanyl-D-alanine carboxypeptidase [Rhizobium sp. 63-7]|nr:MAG: D-alanyl-D-alanine carboxypeptidase [Rhizobium sp. 63-7]
MRTVLQFLVICLLWFGPALAATAPNGAAFETKAKQIYMVEASTGTVIIAKDEDVPVSPASLAKLMTMEIVFDALRNGEIQPTTDYAVSEHAWRTGGAPSRTSTMFAALKSRVSVLDLIQGVTVQLANDACIILAEGMTGSEDAFAERMTKRAREIGLPSATFANPTGLPDPRSRISMRELVTLARHIQSTYPEFFPYYAQAEFEWNKIRQRNRNPLVGANIGVDGFATGFAEGEGYSIVATVNRDGKRLFLAMGGLANEKERLEEARRILDWGISNFETKRIFADGEVIGAASVYGGEQSKVDFVARAPVDVFVPINNPERLAARIVYRWPLKAPVENGFQAGTLRVFSGERLLREVPLYTAAAVGQGTLVSRATDAVLELMFFWL